MANNAAIKTKKVRTMRN